MPVYSTIVLFLMIAAAACFGYGFYRLFQKPKSGYGKPLILGTVLFCLSWSAYGFHPGISSFKFYNLLHTKTVTQASKTMKSSPLSKAPAMKNSTTSTMRGNDSGAGLMDASTNALPQSQISFQNNIAKKLMMEKGATPKILKDGAKEFILTAKPVIWNLYLRKNVKVSGYNGQVPGPLLRVRVGDRVRIILKNQLSQANIDALFELGGMSVGGSTMDNVFTMDGKPYPNAPQLYLKLGQIVVIRLVNNTASYYHAMHMHGRTFKLVALDGHKLAKPVSENVVSLAPEQTADFEFVASRIGDWMFHCHIPDHMTNPDDNADGMGGFTTYFHIRG